MSREEADAHWAKHFHDKAKQLEAENERLRAENAHLRASVTELCNLLHGTDA
jgi:cell division protein FtsB